MSTPLNLSEQETWYPPIPQRRVQRARRSISPQMISAVTRLVDLSAIPFAGWLAGRLYFDNAVETDYGNYQLSAILAAVIFVFTLNHAQGYAVEHLSRLAWQTGRIALCWCLTFSALTIIAFFAKVGAGYSRGWAVVWMLGTSCILVLFRIALYFLIRQMKRQGQLSRMVAIIGTGQVAERLIAKLTAGGREQTVIAGVFDDRGTRVPAAVAGHPVAGTTDRLIAYAHSEPIDEVIIALPLHAGKRIGEIVKKLRLLPADVRLSLDPASLGFPVRGVSQAGSILALEIFDRPLKHWAAIVKWLEDKVLSFTLLLLWAPLMLLVVLVIKLQSPGPVLFRQVRLGFNNQPFEILKFRTMHTHLCDADASRLVSRGDPRVTPIGRVLRRWSLDELPQLINVLRGDMSIVGPRPHAMLAKAADKLYQDVVTNYACRHRVKPGITGWAQVNGWRGETDTTEKIQSRVEHDIYYIDNISIGFDIRIIVLTGVMMLRPRNCY